MRTLLPRDVDPIAERLNRISISIEIAIGASLEQ